MTRTDSPVRLHAECPHCGQRPRLRADPQFMELLGIVAQRYTIETETRALTYQCHIRTCNRIYTINIASLAKLPLAV